MGEKLFPIYAIDFYIKTKSTDEEFLCFYLSKLSM